MFKRVLIANRGEIAVRAIRSCRELGITTVAVYSAVDRSSLHVRLADVALPIGPAPARESYLDGDRILEAARRSGAEAIYPGYGFLAENADFAEACAAAGLVFIGPPPAAMRQMGDKIAARELMSRAGVPVVPGTHGATHGAAGGAGAGGQGGAADAAVGLADADAALLAARALGWPVLLKATAGGGGKGMRAVRGEEELARAFDAARREALAAFGDGTLYLEKLIEGPRHIEIQVLADAAGTTLQLFERDCSLQRRHQKVVEETPSPVLDEATREAMGALALRAARAVGYVGAGTVELLFDRATGSYYFLEMNTRLQVEHPITELCCGVDLVREQLRVAAGERLRWTQEALRPRGAAIECRVYAEDPLTWLPSPGRISALRQPGGPGVRDDSGVYAGAEISSHYDPLISKLCVWGEDRAQAIARMRRALGEYRVAGIATNLPFLRAVVAQAAFAAGDYDTGSLERHRDELCAAQAQALAEPSPAAVAAAALETVWGAPSGAGGAAASAEATAAGEVQPSAWRRSLGWPR
ncbi:MAG: ATP-grasp domain-containing protein [Proteobacteria bacterium]|nr:ATP-grasp domain-containing protein [Pseudomonadota bacterium]